MHKHIPLFSFRIIFTCIFLSTLLIITGCPETEDPPQCETREDCAENEVCIDGECEPAQCTENEECNHDEICNDGLCDPADCEEPCEEGFTCIHAECLCDDNDACEAWEICEEGFCIPDPDAQCSPDRNCLEGFECRDAVCVCARDRVCPDGMVCDDGECREADFCDTDDECTDQGRVCNFGLCTEACEISDDCGSPSFYYACLDGTCYYRCPLGEDTECGQGFICEEFDADNLLCVPSECITLEDCPEENEICSSSEHGRCIEVIFCDSDEDCDPIEYCSAPSPCPPGFNCDDDRICINRKTCIHDSECDTPEGPGHCEQGYCHTSNYCETQDNCDEGYDCVNEVCVPFVCRGPSDCGDNEICSGGVCVVPETDFTVDRVEIISSGRHILPGEERLLRAMAYDNTDRAIIGAPITWSSSNPDAVSIDPESGLITGGGEEEAGIAIITASCEDADDSATWHLLSEINENELRIIVVDNQTGRPVENALVVLSNGMDAGTDETGIAIFEPETEEPLDIHIYHENRDYVSVYAVEGRDLLIPLPRRSNPNRAAGVTGRISLENVSSQGDVSIGLAGVSLAGPLTDFDMSKLMGGIFVANVPGMGEIPLPGAMTAEVRFMQMPFVLKDTYYSSGEEGLRAGWSFAGRLDISTLMETDMSLNISSLLPFFSHFDHGLQPRITLAERNLIQDIQDINGNGDTDEMVPDWLNFPQRNHSPGQSQNLRLNVAAGALPSLDDDQLEAVIFIGGIRTPGIGLVPLGLSGTDETDENGDPANVRMRMTPVYGGLEVGEYQLVAMAVPFGDDMMDIPRSVSARIFTSTDLPRNVQFGNFPVFPEASTWDAESRTLEHAPVDGTHLLRSTIHGENLTWHVYASGDTEETATYILPEPPEAYQDIESPYEAGISPIELIESLNYEALLNVRGSGILNLDQVTSGYSKLIR